MKKKKKSLDDYMNDPDIINEPMALREIHAIRLMIHEERKGLTIAEYNALVYDGAARFLSTENSEVSDN
jgi:hypothetical protein